MINSVWPGCVWPCGHSPLHHHPLMLSHGIQRYFSNFPHTRALNYKATKNNPLVLFIYPFFLKLKKYIFQTLQKSSQVIGCKEDAESFKKGFSLLLFYTSSVLFSPVPPQTLSTLIVVFSLNLCKLVKVDTKYKYPDPI